MKLYTGLDLHSSNCYLGIIDETGKKIFKQKLLNERERILEALKPYKSLRGERVTHSNTDEALIQRGDWYREELMPKLNETAAMVRKSITAKF